jgi:uncharacterized membrane protein
MSGAPRHTIPLVYYLVTPGFILLDYVAGVNIRVAVLDTWPVYKNLYYGLCVVCGVLIYAVRRAGPFVAFVESTVNFTMTILLAFLPYVRIASLASEDACEFEAQLLTVPQAINLFLAGLIAIYGISASTEAIARTLGLSPFSEGMRDGSGGRHSRRRRE